MAGPVTVTCGGCGVAFPVPARVIRVLGHQVLVLMDRSEVYGHQSRCAGFAEPATPSKEASKTVAVPNDDKLPEAELAGRIHLMLAGGHFMATGGSGACTMCGTNRDACLQAIQTVTGPRHPCCPACANGNTHPAPGENAQTCAQWAEANGCRS